MPYKSEKIKLKGLQDLQIDINNNLKPVRPHRSNAGGGAKKGVKKND